MEDKPLIIPRCKDVWHHAEVLEVLNRKISNAGSGHYFLLKKGKSHDTRGVEGMCNNGKTHCCLPAMFCDEVFNQIVEILSVNAEPVGARVRISWALFCHSYRLIPAIIVHMSSSVVFKNHDLFIPV